MSSRRAIATDNAPQAIGPYSQAAAVGPWLYMSGQIPLDPATGEMVEGDISAQAERVMQNLRGVLEAAGGDFSCVVKTTIFLTDLAAFGEVNAVYAKFFQQPYPARATVEVAALPKGAKVEIEAVAYIAANGAA
ncbi:RidA family protein [Magnetofaba australis]|uniref:Putative endoribonuclease L-PSP n=1 Tax=Magnetofaba australis IT-1 TaxID=1434232 RepID=A0A1Y2K065_9PROT|nr:RidA family protein [Magnetofaba australis]OSM01433.1 putative endoribonuclease L-PSP [Magnetofaba australis IT-1]